MRASFNTFAGGEIGDAIAARFDVAKYQTALYRARNTLGLVSGGQYNRAGFEFCSYSQNQAFRSELFDFSFSDDQSYCLEFTEGKMRVYYDGGTVTCPGLIVTAATQTSPLTVTIPDSGYLVGDLIYFSDITGMVEINGLTLRITAKVGDVHTFAYQQGGAVNATGWGAFTGSGGGVAGGSAGGEGGYPPPPAPGDPDPPPPVYPPVNPTPPPIRPPGGVIEYNEP